MSAIDVYITRTSGVLPNEPVGNDRIEEVLGLIGNRPSRTKRVILRQNGIPIVVFNLKRRQFFI